MKWLLRWAMVAIFVFIVVTLCFRCGAGTPTSPSSDVEQALLDETARMAMVMGVRGRGEITTRPHSNADAVGWWLGGIAYYYRPNVERFVGLVPGSCPEVPRCEVPVNVAVHELCHDFSPNHDLLHWTCSAKYATPTYPRP